MENNNEMTVKYKILVNALLQNAKEGYTEGMLRFADEAISAVLTALEPERVSELHRILKEERESR